MSNITQVIRTGKNLTTLKKAIIATNLDQVLSSTGPYTFFAPSDNAFAKLEINTVEDLLKPGNTAKLTDLLNMHLVEGKISSKDLENGQKLKSVNGKELTVGVINGTVNVDLAVVEDGDIKSSNGIIHCIDTVLN